ncbi:MAG: transposase [Dissulfuribacterales bacterium]
MSRQWRIEYPGAIYHVLSRGNNRQDIFKTDDDRHLFLELLEELSARFHIGIYACVLMSNHYHLLLQTHEKNLSRSMQWLGVTYTRRFNLNNRQSGHLFQGRFKSIIVENETYLLRLSYYIHRNPLRAAMVKRLNDYPWSSYRYYGYAKKPPNWLKTKFILSQCHGDNPHKIYRSKMQQYAKEESCLREDLKHGLIYGSQDFVQKIRDQYLSPEKNTELPQHNSVFSDISPEEIVSQASELLDFDIEKAIDAKRMMSSEKDKRDFVLYLLRELGGLSNQKIGSIFNLTYSSVSRRASDLGNRFQKEKKLFKKYQDFKSKIKI